MPPDTNLPRLMTAQEVLQALRAEDHPQPTKFLYHLRKVHKLTAVRIGRTFLYHLDSVRRLVGMAA